MTYDNARDLQTLRRCDVNETPIFETLKRMKSVVNCLFELIHSFRSHDYVHEPDNMLNLAFLARVRSLPPCAYPFMPNKPRKAFTQDSLVTMAMDQNVVTTTSSEHFQATEKPD